MQVMALVNGGLGLVGVFVAAAGAVVCGLFLGRSRFVPVMLGGFLVQAVVGLMYPFAPLAFRALPSPEGMMAVYAVLRVVGLGAECAIVYGIYGLLSERAAARAEAA